MKYSYCLGIRLDDEYMERMCQYKDKCPYYTNVRLSVALANPEQYVELDTYNNRECLYRHNIK